VNSYIRLALDEVFGKEKVKNEIIWKYSGGRLAEAILSRSKARHTFTGFEDGKLAVLS
jgi:hypothetical protein